MDNINTHAETEPLSSAYDTVHVKSCGAGESRLSEHLSTLQRNTDIQIRKNGDVKNKLNFFPGALKQNIQFVNYTFHNQR